MVRRRLSDRHNAPQFGWSGNRIDPDRRRSRHRKAMIDVFAKASKSGAILAALAATLGGIETSEDRTGYGWLRTGGALQPLRQSFGPRLPGRAAADGPALLHQRRRQEFYAGLLDPNIAAPGAAKYRLAHSLDRRS